MDPYRGQGQYEDDVLLAEEWQKLAEWVCPIPDGLMGVGTPGRSFHEDMQFLTAMDLELDKARRGSLTVPRGGADVSAGEGA